MKNNKIKQIKKINRIVEIKKLPFFLCFVGFLFVSLLAIFIPALIGKSIDALNTEKELSRFIVFVIVIFLIYLLKYIISISSNNALVRISSEFMNRLRVQLLSKMIDLPMQYLSKTEKGYLLGRIDECDEVESLFSNATFNSIGSLLTSFFSLFIMFLLNYKLTLIVLAIVPLAYMLSKKSFNKMSKYVSQTMETNAELSAEGFEILNGVEDVKVLGMKEKGLQKFSDKANLYTKYKILQSRSINILEENIEIVCSIAALLILLVSGVLIIHDEITIGLYTAFSLYLTQVLGGVLNIAGLQMATKPALISIERISSIFEMEQEHTGTIISDDIRKIECKNISFRYEKDHPLVLDKFNLLMNAGDKIFIKGANGTGKTTLVKLLLSLYQPCEGSVYINDMDAKLMNSDSIRKRIGVVSQNIFLFKGTVLDNILCAQIDKTREDVIALLCRLKLDDYFRRFPNYLDTDISQNLNGISGGQMQMIAIVRAILSEKSMVIMDEPLSNIDLGSCSILVDLLSDWKFSHILIVISHDMIDNKPFNKTVVL